MRGPSEEDRQQVPYANQHQYYQSMQLYETQAQQYLPQGEANFNGNNSGNYYYPNVQQQGNMPQGYYYAYPVAEPSATSQDESNPFAEYTWMADAEDFDRQVMEQMEQEVYMEACFQQMWEEEEGNEDGWYIPSEVLGEITRNENEVEGLDKLSLNEAKPPTMLNPNAAEFIPHRTIIHQGK